MRKKPLALGKPGGPDGPPIWTVPEQTLAYKIGYWVTSAFLWGALGSAGLALGAVLVHLAF